MWGGHESAGWIHAHLDQVVLIELDLALEEYGLIALQFRIELGLLRIKGWGIGVEWIGRGNVD